MKIRLFFGLGFGIMKIARQNKQTMETWLIFLFVRILISRENVQLKRLKNFW